MPTLAARFGPQQQQKHSRRPVLVAAAAQQQQQQQQRPPPKTTGRRRGKALLQDAALKPGEQDDQLLAEVVRDLRGGIEVSVAGAAQRGALCRACSLAALRWHSSPPPLFPALLQAVNMVQWYPGHIAKAEKALREQLSAVDMVLEVGAPPLHVVPPPVPPRRWDDTPPLKPWELPWWPVSQPTRLTRQPTPVLHRCGAPCTPPWRCVAHAQPPAAHAPAQVRDGRCPMSTRHPLIPSWIGSKPRLLLINRKDMVGEADAAAWTRFFAQRGHAVQWTNGNMGDGVPRVRGWVGAGCQARGGRVVGRRASIIWVSGAGGPNKHPKGIAEGGQPAGSGGGAMGPWLPSAAFPHAKQLREQHQS